MNLAATIRSILKITRAGNLLMICLSLFLIRYTVIQPILSLNDLSSSLSSNTYVLLVLSIIFIAAGGYVINDIFDVGIDAINKPGKNQIGYKLKRKHAMMLYIFLTLSGLAFSLITGLKTGMNYILLINLICAGLLYFYSASYKKMFFIGNVIVSILTAWAIFSSVIYDKNSMFLEPIKIIITAYSFFAFMMSMIREIIKDCEDAEGDKAFDSSTIAVVLGTRTTRIIAFMLSLLLIGAIAYIQVSQKQWENQMAFVYVTAFIQLPLIYLAFRIIRSKNANHDRMCSLLSKVIMFTGILSMPVFYFTS